MSNYKEAAKQYLIDNFLEECTMRQYIVDSFESGYEFCLNEKLWINPLKKLPDNPDFYLVAANTLQSHTDKNHNEVYKIEVRIIFYFKEPNVTGWQKDWTGKPSDVKGWMQIPAPPSFL